MPLLQRSKRAGSCGAAPTIRQQEVPMSSKPKKPAAAPMPPQASASEAKRAVRATAVTAPAHGYYDELATLSRENFDAVLKANAAWADGFEAIASEAVGCARQTLAVTGAATMELLAARTL